MFEVLSHFVAFKTVSSDPLLQSECWKGAKFLYSLLEGLGVETKFVQSKEGKNPIILGRMGSNPSNPTITIYGHYDVSITKDDK
jgi:di- and tripeptidase